MTAQDYKQHLEQARKDLAGAVAERDRWNLEILRLQQVVKALAVQVSQAQQTERANIEWQAYVELAQAIESIVNSTANPVTPVEVRNTLIFYGYDIGRYSNPMAMIHQTLKSLAANGRIAAIRGGTAYTRTAFYNALLKAQ